MSHPLALPDHVLAVRDRSGFGDLDVLYRVSGGAIGDSGSVVVTGILYGSWSGAGVIEDAVYGAWDGIAAPRDVTYARWTDA